MKRVTIGKSPKKKAPYPKTIRTECEGCPDEGMEICKKCIVGMIYDVNDEILQKEYRKAYDASFEDYLTSM